MNIITTKLFLGDKRGKSCSTEYYMLGSGNIEEKTAPHFRRAVSFLEYER